MNSMFSSFDAACNEFLNQKVKSSIAFTAMDSTTRRVSSSTVGEDDLIKNQEGSSSRSWTGKQGEEDAEVCTRARWAQLFRDLR
ncbi:hypothetical protein OIU74_005921 [Salix koriyanagi]|uniref:Uncharacterized protein n=1 Tax=Salix koriyanagi TaxID=2511006 RepID=A0A9Q0UD34_9ROSI|nr:hypothetical protein OIU74_005921 [Salix koriyanagi]